MLCNPLGDSRDLGKHDAGRSARYLEIIRSVGLEFLARGNVLTSTLTVCPREECTAWENLRSSKTVNRLQDPPDLHFRGVWRPPGAPPDRGVLGECEPNRSAQLLRRGQAGGRDAHVRLPQAARHRDPHRPHLQHVRAAHEHRRREGGQQLCGAGTPVRLFNILAVGLLFSTSLVYWDVLVI